MSNFSIKNKLFSNPKQAPLFSVSLKNSKGTDFHLADPKATRAFLACMNMSACLGRSGLSLGGDLPLLQRSCQPCML